ncbi:2Fe-2S iron-sulfur cluster-binding protein [Bacillus sp. EB600]|uniref:2Fe-2S iron-sulfur cluster-binding protein n=1 Tax=Bacillus sp. EB600 TaxID=2806345 RepID=UPI00210DF3D9|nr:2Fe-2S iron-sulfur cluster-binding protein [Bacillus sp. EB600]
MFRITLKNESFYCPETMSVVEVAKLQGVKVPYGCNGGGCGMCKMKITKGHYKLNDWAAKALSDEEKKNGHVFLCQTYPLSDLELEYIRK